MMLGSLDILDGKAVQLENGDRTRKIFERDDLEELIAEFSLTGRVAVIDLNAAFGDGNNKELIAKLCKKADVHVGGGIRDKESAEFYLKAGAQKLIIGTKANEEFLSRFHPDHLLVALDMKGQTVTDQGWTSSTGENFLDRAKRLVDYCSGFLVTQVEKEGLMQGFDTKPLEELRKLTDKQIIAAGGISNTQEIKALADLNIDCQLGMALYSGKLDLTEAFVALGDFSKGLVPTVVQEPSDQILMVGFSNQDSLRQTLKTRKVTFFSRSRNKLWTKGETSGNFLNLKQIKWDCDRDTLLVIADPVGVSCHFGSWSCFGEKSSSLLETLKTDIQNRKNSDAQKSWTRKLLEDPELLKSKIHEEAEEVVNFRDRDNLIWESADLLYHLMVLLEREDISLNEIKAELTSRRKK